MPIPIQIVMTTSRRPATHPSTDTSRSRHELDRRRSLAQRIWIGVIATVSIGSLPSVAIAQDSVTTTTAPTAAPTTTATNPPSITVPAAPAEDAPNTDEPTDTSPSTATPTDAVPEGSDTATTVAASAPPTDLVSTTTTIPSTTTPTTTPPTTTPAAPEPPERNITVFPEQIQHILATIRYLESRGIYTLPPNRGNASGAYQFIGSTWGNYGGYAHAYLAPPHIQDERAAADVNKFLDQWNNDVSMIPVMWYYPVASRNPALMDIVPVPSAGNVLTIREYQTRWLGVFASISGQPIAPGSNGSFGASGSGASAATVTPVDLSALAGFAPEVPLSLISAPAMSFPVLGPSRVAVPQCDGAVQIEVADNADGSAVTDGPTLADNEAAGLCTPQAPGIVFGVKLQPVLAVGDGMVTDVRNVDGEPISVTITNMAGISTTYSGFNDDNPGTDDGAAPDHLRLTALAEVGKGVRAGQIIGFMGDTSPLPIGIRADVPTDSTVQLDPNAIAPHIRIMMVDIEGHPLDTFGPMIDALFRQTCRVMIGQWTVPENGSGFDTVTIETTDNDNSIDSEWNITSTGQVTATGWAALVNPTDGCGYAPDTAFGPGGGGSDRGLSHWENPIELSTDVWIALALQESNTARVFLRR